MIAFVIAFGIACVIAFVIAIVIACAITFVIPTREDVWNRFAILLRLQVA